MIFAPLWFTFGAVHVPSFALPSAFASFAPSLPGDVLAQYIPGMEVERKGLVSEPSAATLAPALDSSSTLY